MIKLQPYSCFNCGCVFYVKENRFNINFCPYCQKRDIDKVEDNYNRRLKKEKDEE